MRIAIVEDDPKVRQTLCAYIDRFYEHKTDRYSITEFDDGDEIVEEYKAEYDLILLDIQMRRLDGMKTAEEIRKLDEHVYLVFVTNLANYAIKGYSVSALDFLLKPVNYLMLRQILQKTQALLEKREKHYVSFPTDRGLSRLDVSQIYYVASQGHNITIYTEKGEFHLRETMKSMEAKLAPYSFYRCDNCYLVNLKYVQNATKNSVMVAETELNVSRPRWKGFMDALTAYIGGEKP